MKRRNVSFSIPAKLKKSVPLRWGNLGEEWLASLPEIVNEACTRFDLILGNPFENAYANYVATAKNSDGIEVVLKVGFPSEEAKNEQETLKAYNGNYSVKALDQSDDLVAILLEKINPGEMLETLVDDEEATNIAAELMKNLHIEAPSNHIFLTIKDVVMVLDRIKDKHPFPKPFFSKALDLYEKLEATKTEEKLLHGDLHHYNILFDQKRGWISIDPIGVIGDPVYEVGQYYHNPYFVSKVKQPVEQSKKRALIFSKAFECTPKRVLDWAYVQCMVSASWSVEDNEDWKGSFEWVEIINKAMKSF